ncbi:MULTISPECIES: hypothetical protein [Nocardiopsis]|uniref:Uncharacterized protein n=1 Tax=Nocardiopsis sinuspersici TaxID=501010 RepID=A0A1V3C6C3_9ACTN|nr:MULTISPECIES: hypothetical protein [Nocardiopsis]OOC56311.1 hypothetical protein NOSIN_22850 [Nocardiopsis sinuspersici]
MSVTDDRRDRRRFTSTVLGPRSAPEPTPLGHGVVRGVVVDASSGVLCLAVPGGEERLAYDHTTSFWRGGEVGPGGLRTGDDAVVLGAPGGRPAAERVWAQAARATGVIVDRGTDTLEIDPGHGRPRLTVVIPRRSSGRISVRHPRLEPGYVFDAVGVWSEGAVWASRPATAQPPHPLAATPHRPPAHRYASTLRGTATWYDPAWGRSPHLDPGARVDGVAYPALDPVGHDAACDRRAPCVPLPLLSVGAAVSLRNDCTREAAVLPVLDCAAADSWLCDLCPACGGRGAGRIASLTMNGFVALGGRLEDGCFDATVTVHDGEG